MFFPFSLWMAAAGLVLALVGWVLYEHYLHPAWRKQRRVVRACEKAFDDENAYQLQRLRTSVGRPSGADLLSAMSFNSEEPPRYFTYILKTAEGEEPDFLGMSRQEISLVRRYLRRSAHIPHHGKEILRPIETENPTRNPVGREGHTR